MTVDEATIDLIHALGNFLSIVGQRTLDNRDIVRVFMSDGDIGRYAMGKAPELREALDNLKHARNIERINADDTWVCLDCNNVNIDSFSHCVACLTARVN